MSRPGTTRTRDPLVSVLMAVYNGERYLRDSIDSILVQSFPDFEFIIVDDGSTDATSEILSDYGDQRIRVITNERNQGLTRSLNIGLSVARGMYVCRQDADDLSLKHRIERQVQTMNRDADLDALGCSFGLISCTGELRGVRTPPDSHAELRARLMLSNPLCHSGLCAKRVTLERIGGYNERFVYAQDYALWWQLSCVGKVGSVPERLVDWRQGAGISAAFRDEQLDFAFQVSLQALAEVTGCRIDPDAYRRFWRFRQRTHTQLSISDLIALRNPWEALWTLGAVTGNFWGKVLTSQANRLVVLGRFPTAAYAFWLAFRLFEVRMDWLSLSKLVARSFLPVRSVHSRVEIVGD